MKEVFELTDSARFEQERMKRAVDSCEDLESLKKVTKDLIAGYFANKAAAVYYASQTLPPPFKPCPTSSTTHPTTPSTPAV